MFTTTIFIPKNEKKLLLVVKNLITSKLMND